jgi:hypothetical protein
MGKSDELREATPKDAAAIRRWLSVTAGLDTVKHYGERNRYLG